MASGSCLRQEARRVRTDRARRRLGCRRDQNARQREAERVRREAEAEAEAAQRAAEKEAKRLAREQTQNQKEAEKKAKKDTKKAAAAAAKAAQQVETHRQEVTGEAKKEKQSKVATAEHLWVPAVNAWGGLGRWAFLEVTDPWDAEHLVRLATASARSPV